MSIFTGSCVALVTPFTEDGINFETLGKMIDFHLKNGTDALLACGTTGEPSTMTSEEKNEVIRFTVEKSNKRVPVIAGAGGNNTKEVVKAAIDAERLGADALLVVNPYYNKTNQKGLYEHYKAIADRVSIPMIIYNVPSRTGMNITPKMLKMLSEIDNIKAIKEASGDIVQVLEMARLCGDKIDIYSGNDDYVVPVLSVGGIGVISVAANIVPKEMHNMVDLFLKDNVKDSRKIQLKLKPLIDALFCEVNPIPVKTAMNLMGFNMGKLRLPLTEMEDNNLNYLKDVLKDYNLI